jgi:two-component system chemotaxis response regulator CheB
MLNQNTLRIIVVGASEGSFKALIDILAPLTADFPLPIVVVRHQSVDTTDYLIKSLRNECQLQVKFAEMNEKPQPGTVYIAPPDRHLVIGMQGELELSRSDPVNFSRPSIEPLFKSAAVCYGSGVLAMVLTGANDDGMEGLIEIKKRGGKVLVQDPASAQADTMPIAAINAVNVDHVVWLSEIGPFLWDLTRPKQPD